MFDSKLRRDRDHPNFQKILNPDIGLYGQLRMAGPAGPEIGPDACWSCEYPGAEPGWMIGWSPELVARIFYCPRCPEASYRKSPN